MLAGINIGSWAVLLAGLIAGLYAKEKHVIAGFLSALIIIFTILPIAWVMSGGRLSEDLISIIYSPMFLLGQFIGYALMGAGMGWVGGKIARRKKRTVETDY